MHLNSGANPTVLTAEHAENAEKGDKSGCSANLAISAVRLAANLRCTLAEEKLDMIEKMLHHPRKENCHEKSYCA
jgi:hypothetical protein